MSVFQRQKLPRRQSIEFNIVQTVGGGIRRPIEHVGTEQTVFLGEFVVNARGEKVFVDDLLS